MRSFDITSSTTKLTCARSQSGGSPEGHGDEQQETHLHEHPLNESPPLGKTPPLDQIEREQERQKIYQDVKMIKNQRTAQVTVTNSPFILEFDLLMLRDPDTTNNPAEQDVGLDDGDLEDLAMYAWAARGY